MTDKPEAPGGDSQGLDSDSPGGGKPTSVCRTGFAPGLKSAGVPWSVSPTQPGRVAGAGPGRAARVVQAAGRPRGVTGHQAAHRLAHDLSRRRHAVRPAHGHDRRATQGAARVAVGRPARHRPARPGLATMLGRYEAASKPVRIGETVRKGYTAEDLWESWSRYLTDAPNDPPEKGYKGYTQPPTKIM
jgi:Protein of unknown function (DUF3631)